MNLQTIQEQINKKFQGDGRRLVFWYDDKGEFINDIDRLVLDNATIYRLTGDNTLYTKFLFECEDQTNNYLIYAPFPKPADKDNHLADTAYYSRQFFTDRVSLLCSTYAIPEKYKEQLSHYGKFWKSNERIDKFVALGIEEYNPEIIEIGLLAVMVGETTPSLDEILKKMINRGGLKENKYLVEFEKMDLLSSFWALCAKYYGYTEENKSFEKLVATLLVTHTANSFTGELPKIWQPFVSHKKNDVAIFVSNFMNNIYLQDRYDKIAREIGRKLKVDDFLASVPTEKYFECDTFAAFDVLIIKAVVEDLVNRGAPLAEEHREMIRNRSARKHFSQTYQHHYKALDKADQLVGGIQAFSKELLEVGNADGFIQMYAQKWESIDRYYRGFYTAYDKIPGDEALHQLRGWVENLYTNAYLLKLSIAWADTLEKVSGWHQLAGEKQWHFYQRQVAAAVKREVTVVIISDALRYEAGVELDKRLNERANTKSEISPMISVLPSVTRLGMAALLPHQSLTINSACEVLVDGMPCLSSEQREKILKTCHPRSVVASYQAVMAMNRESVRKLMTGQELITIYHNQIDARGDHMATENEVFTAVDETVSELMNLIQKLTVDKSITNYIITADHGFIYKRDKLDESDKVTLSKQSGDFINKRFILSNELPDLKGTLTYSLDYAGAQNSDVLVTVPRGVDVFKTPGGGQNFVHGGASLQEIVIPLIKVKTEKRKQNVENVEVVLTSVTRKINNLIVYLDFLQKEAVTDRLRPARIEVYFESASGDKISDREIIVADRKDQDVDNRMFKEKFIFRNQKYSKDEKYDLVMKDVGSDIEVARHEFIIDIAFADDFGF
ncbi:BREX-1 system phosphatase PglZ type A [Acetobacterium malicum]|uniref:BREX-1 system phosphatase PglZ type A n=1 Tax=Acetobacterium malicum TaxID=52692 RepID=UPI00041FFEAF|nr:BREX-1 system phosphatase PglZ type A [Acetobacterium dehalogenans]